MNAKKPTRSKKPVHVKSHRRRSPDGAPGVSEIGQGAPATAASPTAEDTAPMKGWGGTGWIALGLVSMVAAVMLIGTPEPSRSATPAAADTGAESRASQPAPQLSGDVAERPKTAAVKRPAAVPAPPAFARPESAAPTLEPSVAPVTITGCLEQADEGFRLKNTEGPDVQKSRSWKSGFLKRTSPRIDIVDAGRRWNLPGHVGQRVSVTGTLVDREMRIQSLSRVSSSCTAGSLAS